MGLNVKLPIDLTTFYEYRTVCAKKKVGPLRGHLIHPLLNKCAQALAGIVLSDRLDAGVAYLSITVANAMIDVVLASGKAIPGVTAHG